MTIPEAAIAIGVSDRYLRNWVNGAQGCVPALPVKTDRRGNRKVDPKAAFDWICQHARHRPPGLRDPGGQSRPAIPDEPSQALGDLGLPTDPREFLQAIFARPDLLRTLPPEQLKIAKAYASELRLQESTDARLAAKLDPRDVIRMLQGLVALFVATMDELAAADAGELLRLIRHEFSVDLVERSASALAILENHIRERGNVVLDTLRKDLAHRVEAVRLVEISA